MLKRAREYLERRGIERPRLDAELLVAKALCLQRMDLFLQLERPVTKAEVDCARELLVRRAAGEPVAYLTGVREFYGREFLVGPGVLIPRPETELLVDRARELARDLRRSPLRIADMGTGCGCIGITLALELPGSRVRGSDCSEQALRFARLNADRLSAGIELVHGDGPGCLMEGGPYDLFVSNPPYVESPEDGSGDGAGDGAEEGAAGLLDPSVPKYEPSLALFAPPGDPDYWVRTLLEQVPDGLAPGGRLLVELGAGQGARALALAQEQDLPARLSCDYEGVPRLLEVSPEGSPEGHRRT
jgi:release factor glutamine methyltransferase